LGGSILFAIMHGLIYVLLIPPWQHYDEPGHFEYAWLLANRAGLPEAGEYDQGMRREVAASMVEHDFFGKSGSHPNLIATTEPVWIGISQTDDQPIYYWLVSLPLRLVKTSDITFQLYLGRLVSFILYLLTILTAYLTIRELTQPESKLRWLVPGTIALLPGFTDLMTAVNNDVGAVAFFSLFLWLCVRVLRRAGDWLSLLGMAIFAIICFFVKNTVMIAIPLAVIAGLFGILHGKLRPFAWGIVGLLIVIMSLVSLRFNGAVSWYTQGPGIGFQSLPEGRVLKFASTRNTSTDVLQSLSQVQVGDLRGETVTVGAWVWGTHEMQTYTPRIMTGSDTFFETIEISTTPSFRWLLVNIPENVERLTVSLKAPSYDREGEVFYDEVMLVKGDLGALLTEDASLEDDIHQTGDLSKSNLLSNPSFEQAWLRILSSVDQRLASWLQFEPSQVLSSLSDIKVSKWYYQATLENLFRTFWAKFGWGHILLVGEKPYRILLLATLLSITGIVIGTWRMRRSISIEILFFIGITLLALLAAAVGRGIGSLFGTIFIPGARYVYPGIIFFAFLLCFGWRELIQLLKKRLHIPATYLYSVYIVSFVFLDIYSIYSIMHYYASLP
jgi:hypothetical protein